MIDSFSEDWDTFASDWILGDVPVSHRETVRIALKTVQEYQPDKVQKHIVEQRRGLGPMGDLVCDGLLIKECKDTPGFAPVFARFCNGDKSADSELRVCTEFAALDLLKEMEPLRHGRRPDAVCEVGGSEIWVEVMCPDQSDLTDATYSDMKDLVELLMPCAEWRSIEVTVTGSLDSSNRSKFIEAAQNAELDKVVELDDGNALCASAYNPDSTNQSLPTKGPQFVVTSTILGGRIPARVTVRAPASDDRAQRLMTAELKHFNKDDMNLLVFDLSRIHAFSSWTEPLTRRFQPNQNTRLGGILLFEYGRIGAALVPSVRGKLLVNPYAKHPLPSAFVDAIAAHLPPTFPGFGA